MRLCASFKRDPALNLAERSQILPPIIKLCRARVGMVRHVLGGFERTAIKQKYRHAGASESMIAEFLAESRDLAAGFDDIEHVAPENRLAGEPLCLVERLEQGRFLILYARS